MKKDELDEVEWESIGGGKTRLPDRGGAEKVLDGSPSNEEVKPGEMRARLDHSPFFCHLSWPCGPPTCHSTLT